MNALEKYAAKRFLTEALFYKLAELPPADVAAVRGRANSMFAEMGSMKAKPPAQAKPPARPVNPTRTTTTAMKMPPLNIKGRPQPPANPLATVAVPAKPPAKVPPLPTRTNAPATPIIPTSLRANKAAPTRRPVKTTVMQGSTGANVTGGFKFDQKAAQAAYLKKRGTYSKNKHMDRTIHFSRARRAALAAHKAKQAGQ